ncbi:MAG TPA: hypothetical protein VFM37_03790 [Pseudonocardiaceae bacterium]|nr:hypothetical protein [Pseudonocardiaceae bacterium]
MIADASGWRARFGLLVIDKDPVAESEFWAMAPSGVTAHVARFESPRAPGTSEYGDDPARIVARSPDVARGLTFFGGMRLDAICLCFTTSSFLGGFGSDERFADEAARRAPGIPVVTAASAAVQAMAALGVRRPFVVSPPWFKDGILDAARAYFADAGYQVSGQLRFDLGVGWRGLQPWQVWDAGGQWEIRPEQVYHQVRRGLPADADAVLIAGNGFSCLPAIEPLEHDLGVPVITSNQACVWKCLRTAGVTARIAGAGRLLSGSVTAAPRTGRAG